MSIRIPLPVVAVLVLAAGAVTPVFGQMVPEGADILVDGRDEAAILGVMRLYESAFNTRDIEARMSLCLESYQEFGFEGGMFLQARDYDETRREVGRYWADIRNLDYSIDEIEITLDGPQAFVRAYTTHLARDEQHSSVVHFALVKIDGTWRIAWNSYNIVSRYE